jgi:hypothetical protein
LEDEDMYIDAETGELVHPYWIEGQGKESSWFQEAGIHCAASLYDTINVKKLRQWIWEPAVWTTGQTMAWSQWLVSKHWLWL